MAKHLNGYDQGTETLIEVEALLQEKLGQGTLTPWASDFHHELLDMIRQQRDAVKVAASTTTPT